MPPLLRVQRDRQLAGDASSITSIHSSATMRPRSFGSNGAMRASTARSSGRRQRAVLPTSSHSGLTATSSPLSFSTPTISTKPSTDPLPDFPPWAICLLAGALTFGFTAAILLWLVQFYHPRRSSPRTRAKCNSEYRQIENEEYEMECYSTSTPSWQNAAVFSSLAGHSVLPNLAPAPSPAVAEPSVRRRKPKNLSIDTGTQYKGLGIAIPGQQNHEQPSPAFGHNDEQPESYGSDCSDCGGGSSLKKKKKSPTRTWQPPFSAPVDITERFSTFERSKKAFRESRDRHPDSAPSTHSDEERTPLLRPDSFASTPNDLESGLLSSTKPLDKPGKYMPNLQKVSGSPNDHLSSKESLPDSSRSSSRVRLVLDKVENGIDWATGRAVRMFHDQMKEDWEEGLLLPVRAEERCGGVH